MNDQIHAESFFMTKLKEKNDIDIKKNYIKWNKKWGLFKSNIFIINNHINNYYYQISLGDDDVKKSLLLDCII